MRHSDIRLTMHGYTSLQVRDVADSLTKLPPIPWSGFGEASVMRATGTEDQSGEFRWTKNCTHPVENQRLSTIVSGHRLGELVGGPSTNNPHFLRGNEGFCKSVNTAEEEPPLGFEPRTYALRKHRSAN